jgi:SAM-dependent methyltransferase
MEVATHSATARPPPLRIGDGVREALRCPICHAGLEPEEGSFACTGVDCRTRFPVMGGVPILLNEASSVFSISDFTGHSSPYFQRPASAPKEALLRLVPPLGRNTVAAGNYRRLARLLLERNPAPRVLVVGGSVAGNGFEELTVNERIEVVSTDVALSGRTHMVCDAHDLPFEDGTFDAVVAQAVLEHVVDPWRCVEEFHRVLRPGGLVFAETPFMQQVHGGRYDFTRFTHLGHRRLFRRFEQIASGAVGGPGTVLAWSYRYMMVSFTRRRGRGLLSALAHLAAAPLKYLDRLMEGTPGELDGASAYYFLGSRSDSVLPDRELLRLYQGMY